MAPDDADHCGYETAQDGTPCQLPASRIDGRCHLHTDEEGAQDKPGRPKAMDKHKERIVFTAVGSGLNVRDQANLAQVSKKTLRRHACCLDTLREPEIVADDPCEFCRSYVQAHSRGAMEVLEECRPEFVASASYGYVKEEKTNVENTGDEPLSEVVIDLGDQDT